MSDFRYQNPNDAQPPAEEQDKRRLYRAFIAAAEFTALLWLIKLAELLFDMDFSRHGVHPRHLAGLAGIVAAPLIHASVYHLFANTGPLLILGTALIYGYPRSARVVIPVVYLGSGLGVWLFGREAYHIGASGLNFGMLSFIFTIGVLRWDRRAIALSMLVFFLYGGMIWGILPTRPGISFESHFFGAVLGVLLAVVLRDRDPRPPDKRYSWEDEDEVEEQDGWEPSGDSADGGAPPPFGNPRLSQGADSRNQGRSGNLDRTQGIGAGSNPSTCLVSLGLEISTTCMPLSPWVT